MENISLPPLLNDEIAKMAIKELLQFAKEEVRKEMEAEQLPINQKTLCKKFGFNQEQLEKFMLTKAKLGLNEGRVYQKGLEGFMRLNAACPRGVLEKAVNQLKDAILKEK